jgi:hypothetical protein
MRGLPDETPPATWVMPAEILFAKTFEIHFPKPSLLRGKKLPWLKKNM